MIKRIVGILVVLTLQIAALACSTQQDANTHTVCPEATMTLSDNDTDDNQSAAIDNLQHEAIAIAEPTQNGTETLTAQSRLQARTAAWQWQREVREAAKCLLIGDNHAHCIKTFANTETYGIDSQSTGYVYVIRHIVI